ncbi:MAG: hypothetical protein EZS28_053458, partial [Streblomastix strix]
MTQPKPDYDRSDPIRKDIERKISKKWLTRDTRASHS